MSFGYGGDHRITSRTNGRGAVTTFAYDAASRVSGSTLALSPGTIGRTIANWQTKGLSGTAASPASVEVVLTGPRPGAVTRFALNRHAAPTTIVDAALQTTTLVRNGGMPGWVTRVTNPAGHVVDAVYDPRGRLQSRTEPSPAGGNATTTFQWDAKFDQVTRVTNPVGDYTDFGIDPGSGNRQWQQDSRGLASRYSFSYNASNQLQTIAAPDGTTEDHFYDGMGNLNSYYNQLDMQWSWTSNSIGLTTSAKVPTGSVRPPFEPFETTSTTYNARNEPLTSTTSGGSASKTVTNGYDPEGNLLSVQRTWSPNQQSIAAQTTSYVYDNADRATSKTESSGGTESTGYDEAGNVTSITSRRNSGVSMGYDLLNRLTSRSMSDPGYTYPAPAITPVTGVENGPYNYTTTNESQSFTWDPTNQIATATGTDATVTRGYHSSGALLGETQVIFTRSRTGTPHSYTLSYTYDANGRRTSLTVSPSTLFAGAPMTWSYTSWGALGSVSDIASNAYSYGYNGRGDLTSITYPGGVSETIGYDNAGRLATDQITRGGATTFPYPSSATLRNFAATRNARGQILNGSDQANAGNGFPTSTYSGLGYLTTNQMTQTGYQFRSGLLGTFTSTDNVTSDGLGNILASNGGWGLPPTAVTTNTINTYNADGRLVQQVNTTGGTSRTTSTAFDAAGNTRFETTRPSGGSSVDEERASYYRGDERVVAIDRRVSGRRTLEEFRYDPLGRRVWVSTQTTCAPTSDITCLTSAVRRTVWDGDRELAELQAPVDPAAPATEELDANVPPLPFVPLPGSTSYGDPNPFFGRVVYGPGLAPDQPMSVTRYEYRDNPGTLTRTCGRASR